MTDGCTESEINQYRRFTMTVEGFRRAEIVDAETFAHVEKCVFRDKDFLYRSNVCGNVTGRDGAALRWKTDGPGTLEILEAFETNSFRDLGCYFYLTYKGVFWSDKIIKEADPVTFEIFNQGKVSDCKYNFYAKDKNSVFFQNLKVAGAAPATFRVTGVNGFEGADKNRQYSWGRRTE